MGLEAYRAEESAKRRARRQRKKTPPVEAKQEIADLGNELNNLVISTFNDLKENKTPIVNLIETKQPAVAQIRDKLSCVALIKKIADEGSRVKEKSLKGYLGHIGTIYKKLYKVKKWDCTGFDFLDDTDNIIDFIHDTWSNRNTRATKLNSVTSILKYFPKHKRSYDIYAKINTKTAKDNDFIRGEGIASEQIIPWETIISKANKIRSIDGRTIISLMICHPPRRSGTYRAMKLQRDIESKGNFIKIDEKNNATHMVLNVYKTDSTYGRYVHKFNNKCNGFTSVFKKYMKKHKLNIGDYLFQKQSGGVYNQSNFSNYIGDITEKYLGVRGTTRLRQSFSTFVMKRGFDINTPNELKRVARKLGHSVSEMAKYARR
jgi:hypothetical protein